MVAFNLSTGAGLAELEAHLTTRSYISGCVRGPVLQRCGGELCLPRARRVHLALVHSRAARAARPSAGWPRSRPTGRN